MKYIFSLIACFFLMGALLHDWEGSGLDNPVFSSDTLSSEKLTEQALKSHPAFTPEIDNVEIASFERAAKEMKAFGKVKIIDKAKGHIEVRNLKAEEYDVDKLSVWGLHMTDIGEFGFDVIEWDNIRIGDGAIRIDEARFVSPENTEYWVPLEFIFDGGNFDAPDIMEAIEAFDGDFGSFYLYDLTARVGSQTGSVDFFGWVTDMNDNTVSILIDDFDLNDRYRDTKRELDHLSVKDLKTSALQKLNGQMQQGLGYHSPFEIINPFKVSFVDFRVENLLFEEPGESFGLETFHSQLIPGENGKFEKTTKMDGLKVEGNSYFLPDYFFRESLTPWNQEIPPYHISYGSHAKLDAIEDVWIEKSELNIRDWGKLDVQFELHGYDKTNSNSDTTDFSALEIGSFQIQFQDKGVTKFWRKARSATEEQRRKYVDRRVRDYFPFFDASKSGLTLRPLGQDYREKVERLIAEGGTLQVIGAPEAPVNLEILFDRDAEILDVEAMVKKLNLEFVYEK